MEPVLVRPGEGETITDRAARSVRILLAEEQLTVTWSRYEPGERGPDPHVHRRHADGFYVLEGEIEFRLGPDAARVVRAPAGTVVIAPPNVVHTFRNDSGERAVYLNFHAPDGGFADFLRSRRDGREPDGWDNWDPPADGGRPAADGIVRMPGEAEWFDRGDRKIGIRAELPEISLNELAVEPEWPGIGEHDHADHLDAFFVLDGEGNFLVRGKPVRAPAGTFVAATPGVRHGVAAATGGARLLNVHAPDAGFAQWIRA